MNQGRLISSLSTKSEMNEPEGRVAPVARQVRMGDPSILTEEISFPSTLFFRGDANERTIWVGPPAKLSFGHLPWRVLDISRTRRLRRN